MFSKSEDEEKAPTPDGVGLVDGRGFLHRYRYRDVRG
jgi:hypothetical protein